MYRVSAKNANGLFNAIALEDNELVAAYIKDIYVELFDNTQYLNGDELDTFTAQVDVSSDEGTDGINAELDKLYDFCDAYNVDLFGDEADVRSNPEEDEGIDEKLVERELSTKERSISKIFLDNKDRIDSATSKEELISVVRDLLKEVNPERTRKIFAALNSKRDYLGALMYIYDFILKGDDLGVIRKAKTDRLEATREDEEFFESMDSDESYFDLRDDEIEGLFTDNDVCEFDDDPEFVPDDVTSIDMIEDDDGVRESITDNINECTSSQVNLVTSTGTARVDRAPKRANEIDTTMDDTFTPDDDSDIVITD